MVKWRGVESKCHEKVNANLKFLVQAVDKEWILSLDERSLSCSVGIPAVHLLILEARSCKGFPRFCLLSQTPQTHSGLSILGLLCARGVNLVSCCISPQTTCNSFGFHFNTTSASSASKNAEFSCSCINWLLKPARSDTSDTFLGE